MLVPVLPPLETYNPYSKNLILCNQGELRAYLFLQSPDKRQMT